MSIGGVKFCGASARLLQCFEAFADFRWHLDTVHVDHVCLRRVVERTNGEVIRVLDARRYWRTDVDCVTNDGPAVSRCVPGFMHAAECIA